MKQIQTVFRFYIEGLFNMSDAFIFTVTVFNKYKNKANETSWKRTVLENCYFGAETAQKLNGNILSPGNSFVCRIPQNKGYTNKFNGEDNKFTLAPGDVIVKGKITDEIKDVSGSRITDLLQKYKGECFAVKSFSDNTLLRHKPHYRVRGE